MVSCVYLVNGKHRIARPFLWFLVSTAISLLVMTLLSIVAAMILGDSDVNLLGTLPRFAAILLVIWGVYTGIGVVVLWIAMWVYWVAEERSTFSVRAAWFFALLLGMYYGALAYAIYLWRQGHIKPVASHLRLEGTE